MIGLCCYTWAFSSCDEWGLLFVGVNGLLRRFPRGSPGKESACNAGDLGLVPELGRSPGEGKGYPLQYSGLQNSRGHKELDTTEQLSLHYGLLTEVASLAEEHGLQGAQASGVVHGLSSWGLWAPEYRFSSYGTQA